MIGTRAALVLSFVLLTARTVHAAPTPEFPALFWVNGSASASGDGTQAAPWNDLSFALAHAPANSVLRLAPGRYPGPVTLPEGLALEGVPGVVIVSSDDAPVVTAGERTRLMDLRIEGGPRGLECRGAVELRRVQLAAQTDVGLLVTSGALRARDVRVENAGPGGYGLKVSAGAQAEVQSSVFHGRFRRAIELEPGARAALRHSSVQGSEVALHAKGASLDLEAVLLQGRGGPGIFIAGGTAHLRHVHVIGHEYALLVRAEAKVEVEDLVSSQAQRAAVGVVGARLDARDLKILDSGSLGGVQGVGAELYLDGFDIWRPTSYGVIVVGGAAHMRDGRVIGVRADRAGTAGEGLHLSNSEVRAHDLLVRNTEGPCVVAMESSRVLLEELRLEGCSGSAIQISGRSQVEVNGARIALALGAACTVTDHSTLVADRWVLLPGSEGPVVVAACGEDVHVWAGRMESVVHTGLDARCVHPFVDRPRGFAH